jgi:uncharacterized tellurite resistance protein B-like protein
MAEETQNSTTGDAQGAEAKPKVRVTVCALLLAMAHVDYEYLPEEREVIAELLKAEFDLNDGEMETLFSAADTERKRYSNLWPFVETINDAYSDEEKQHLLVMLWKVIFADKRLDSYEELLMRKLEPMLAVDHEMVVEAMRLARGGAELQKPKM